MPGSDDSAVVLDSLAAQSDQDSGQATLANVQAALSTFIQADSAYTYAVSTSAGNMASALSARGAALLVLQSVVAALT